MQIKDLAAKGGSGGVVGIHNVACLVVPKGVPRLNFSCQSLSRYTLGHLNELKIRAAQPREIEYLLPDGDGLYLRIRPTGRSWTYRYKQAGRQIKLSLGSYPAVTLAAARKKARGEAERRANGIDPQEVRRELDERERVARLNSSTPTGRALICASDCQTSPVIVVR